MYLDAAQQLIQLAKNVEGYIGTLSGPSEESIQPLVGWIYSPKFNFNAQSNEQNEKLRELRERVANLSKKADMHVIDLLEKDQPSSNVEESFVGTTRGDPEVRNALVYYQMLLLLCCFHECFNPLSPF